MRADHPDTRIIVSLLGSTDPDERARGIRLLDYSNKAEKHGRRSHSYHLQCLIELGRVEPDNNEVLLAKEYHIRRM